MDTRNTMKKLGAVVLASFLGIFAVLHHINRTKDSRNIDTDRQLNRDTAARILELVRDVVEPVRDEQLEPMEVVIRDTEKDNSIVEQEADVPFTTLLADYRKQIKALKDGGYWRKSPENLTCDQQPHPARPCIDKSCNVTVTFNPQSNLRGVLRSMTYLDKDTLAEISRRLKPRYTHKKVLFVTAASDNHFEESQALVQNLHNNVFPLLTNYSFVYYDLGLTAVQRSQLEQYCRCEVRTFPLSSMPLRLQNLKCYTWKPLIIHANLPTADMLVWTDASVRFMKGMATAVLHDLEKKGLNINWGIFPIAQHTTGDTFRYFGEKTCSFSNSPEIEANFVTFVNNRFVRQAVIKPWAACALSPMCMCTYNAAMMLSCKSTIRKYNKCHRFDQSALGIILGKLFRGYEASLKTTPGRVRVIRGHKEKYFETLAQQRDALLFKSFV